MSDWDPSRYLHFGSLRTRPAVELLSRVPASTPRLVVDLGCGPGNSTSLLVERWPDSTVIGVDHSPEMLAEARRRLPRVEFVEGELETWSAPGPVDVIFSNAALHWVDDHRAVLIHLLNLLNPGGVLAIQMPDNFDAPSHRLLRELAATPVWQRRLRGVLRSAPVATPAWYHRFLSAAHAASDIWTTEYLQVLEGEDPVFGWVSGTALLPVRRALNDAEFAEFAAEYRRRLAAAYPPEPDGATLFPFKRLFIVAQV